MKEYNFKNADIIVDDILIFDKSINHNEDIKFDSTANILGSIDSSAKIIANYSLVVNKNLNGEKIIIGNDLICYGNINCETLEVNGSLKCYGEVNAKTLIVMKDCVVDSAIISEANILGNLIVMKALEIIQILRVKYEIICLEGVLGQGKIQCEYIYAKDYLEIEIDEGKMISDNDREGIVKSSELDSILNNNFSDIDPFKEKEKINSLENIIRNVVDSVKNNIIQSEFIYDISNISNVLEEFISLDYNFKFDSQAIRSIEYLQDIDEINDISIFLEILDSLEKASPYIKKLKIYEYVYSKFLKKQKKKLLSMKMEKINKHSEFIQVLKLLEENKSYFSNEEYTYFLDQIYKNIGIKSSLVLKILENNN